MAEKKQESGIADTPIQYRTHAVPRNTEEGRSRQTTSRRPVIEDEGDGWAVEKSHSSAVRLDRPQRSRETTRLQPAYTKKMKQRRFDRPTLLIWLCLAVIVMILGWFALNALSNWWQGVQDNMKYGNPRTFQVDQYVYLGDSPAHPDHFIAVNLHGEIEVIEINPLDHTRDFIFGLTNVGNESIPVTLSFRDTTGDGRTDVIVTIGDSTPYTLVLLNNGKTFVPTQPAH